MKNFENETRHYFFIARQFLTHATLLVYIGTVIFRCKSFKNSFNSLLINSTAPMKITCTPSFIPLFIFFITNCLWTVGFILYFIIKGDNSIAIHFLHVEDIIMVLVESQICLMLFLVCGILLQLEEWTKCVVELHQVHVRRNLYYGELSIACFTEEHSFEDLRFLHLRVFNAMSLMNDYFGIANLVFILAARFTFAFYLYSSLSQSFKVFDFLISCFNFQRIFFICYWFQAVKNQEKKLRTCVNETNTQMLDEKSLTQFELFNSQIHILELKFDAYGLFPLDFTTVLSILTTTAGYLVILSQMNV